MYPVKNFNGPKFYPFVKTAFSAWKSFHFLATAMCFKVTGRYSNHVHVTCLQAILDFYHPPLYCGQGTVPKDGALGPGCTLCAEVWLHKGCLSTFTNTLSIVDLLHRLRCVPYTAAFQTDEAKDTVPLTPKQKVYQHHSKMNVV